MIIFPAVDIRGGKVVRLRQGKKDECEVFHDSPLEMAQHWRKLGAGFLHIVDLDGAFADREANFESIENIAANLDIPVQVGGGIRTLDRCDQYIAAGARRLIIGTVALEKPDLFAAMCGKYPDRIGISLDAADGILKTRGWLSDNPTSLEAALKLAEDAGAAFVIYTDISRDGTRQGINAAALEKLLTLTRLPVIAAGGVNTLEDIKKCHALKAAGNLEGVISGKALYEKTLDLPQALQWLAEAEKQS